MSTKLKKKIQSKKCLVAVMGLGYVGLPLALSFAKKGFPVVGMDNDSDRLALLERKRSYISDVPSRDIREAVRRKRFRSTADFSQLSNADVILICVPTPLKKRYTPDVSYMVKAVKTVARFLTKDTLIVLESTTYPGTTREMILPILESSGLKVGRDFFLAFSPERIDPGNKKYDVTRIPKLAGGITPACGRLTQALYEKVIRQVHLLSSTEAAEMAKLLENSFRIINIGWINEVAVMCHKMGIDIWEVIDGAATKPFGFMPFYPGLGVGGHCIPDDPLYLFWKARQYGFSSRYIKLSADTNHAMPAYAVERIRSLLKKQGRGLRGARLLVCGVTYKKDVKDLRKSPPLALMEILKKKGVKLDYHDPIIPYLDIGSLKMKSVPLTEGRLRRYDLVVIATDHSKVNYNRLAQHARYIFDTRRVYRKRQPHIERL